jgi:hypothetical protein
MLKITCFKCQWGWSLNREAVEMALASVESGATHYMVACPKCRRMNKIPVTRLKAALPRQASEQPGED